jgi:very-short-patch-repair endonuclease
VVEIDGGEHHEEESDRRKTVYLESQGFRVLRIPVSDTDQHLYEVLNSILAELQTNRSSPP